MENRLLLIISAFGLLFCLIALSMQCLPVLFGASKETQDWVYNCLINTGTGMITSSLVIFLYNRQIDKRENKSREERRIYALEQLSGIILTILRPLYQLYKGTATQEPQHELSSFDDLFDDEFYENIRYLDSKNPWANTIENNLAVGCTFLYTFIENVNIQYNNVFDNNFWLPFRKLKDLWFLNYMMQVPKIKMDDPENVRPIFQVYVTTEGGFKEFMSLLITLIKLYNSEETSTKIIPSKRFLMAQDLALQSLWSDHYRNKGKK